MAVALLLKVALLVPVVAHEIRSQKGRIHSGAMTIDRGNGAMRPSGFWNRAGSMPRRDASPGINDNREIVEMMVNGMSRNDG